MKDLMDEVKPKERMEAAIMYLHTVDEFRCSIIRIEYEHLIALSKILQESNPKEVTPYLVECIEAVSKQYQDVTNAGTKLCGIVDIGTKYTSEEIKSMADSYCKNMMILSDAIHQLTEYINTILDKEETNENTDTNH